MTELKNRPSFLAAVAAAFFLAMSAYVGAWLGPLVSDSRAVTPQWAERSEELPLHGLVIRREQPCSLPEGSCENGVRLPAFAPGDGSVLYFSSQEGAEPYSRALVEAPTVSALRERMAQRTPLCPGGRFVRGFDWYYAAPVSADAPLEQGQRYSLAFDGLDPLPARLVTLSPAEEGERAAVFRLTRGLEADLPRLSPGALGVARVQGWLLPLGAAAQTEKGETCLILSESGREQTLVVELLWQDGREMLVFSPLLTEKSRVLCPCPG